MRPRPAHWSLIPLVAAGLIACNGGATAATTAWPMYHFDQGRSGNDTGEPSFSNLGNAWNSSPLDGSIYAEPLVAGNLVVVATENNSLYAFNAVTGSPQWGPIHLGTPRTSGFPCGDINPLGITGTPVIDGGFLYAVAEVQTSPTAFEFHLAKVNAATGAVSYNVPITPSGMDTNVEQERSALAVSSGNVVVVWGGLDGDCGTYHGYIETVAESDGTAQQQWSDTMAGREGGMWAPSGPAVDPAGNIYVSTGNGSSTTITSYDYGDSLLKFSPVLDMLPSFFAPTNWASLNASDTDLGSMGPSLLPNGLLFAIGKGGRGYLLNQSALPSHSNPGGGENFSAAVCHASSSAAFGGLAVSGNIVFVPCVDGIAAVSVDSPSSFHTLWYSTSGGGSAPIVAGGLVWTLTMFGGTNLYGLQPGTGHVTAVLKLPAVTQHFATPAAGDGMLLVGAGNRLAAFAPASTLPPPRFTPNSVGPPSVAVTNDGTAQLVFWRGPGNHLVEAWYAAGSWHGPLDLTVSDFGGAAPLQSDPSAAVTADGSTQLVFWQGASNHLFEAWYAAGSWHGPLDVSASYLGGAARLASTPSVAVTPDGTQQLVYWRGAGNHLNEAWYAGGRWNGPLDLTGTLFGGVGPLGSAPSATVTRDGSTQLVFWQGSAAHLLEAWYAGGHWSGPVDWTSSAFGGAARLVSGPSVTTTRDGTQQLVYWQGAGGQLDEAWWAGGRWNGPVDLTAAYFGGGGPLTSAPSAAVTPDGSTQLVFWQGPGQSLWEAWYTGRWNGPHNFSAG
ncbi:MAG TPA: PQQ-binding-like beta-propeller repeat protein [Candidatus Dormibacteraeota bacterium]